MVAQFRVVSRLDFIIIVILIIFMSNFLVVLGCSDDDSVSLSSPTVPVMSVSVSPANSSSLPPLEPILHKIQTTNNIHAVVRLL